MVYIGVINCNDVVVGVIFLFFKVVVMLENVNYLVVGMSFCVEFGDYEVIEDIKFIKCCCDGFFVEIFCISMSGNFFCFECCMLCFVMYGLQIVVVVGVLGNEVEVDKYGCVKVQFFWDCEGGKDVNSFCWVCVVQLWVGKGMGMWMILCIGYEVVVSFVGGDLDWFLVIGLVYNDVNLFVYELFKFFYVSGWCIYFIKEGVVDMYSELCFVDEKIKEYVWLQFQCNFYWYVKEDVFDFVEKNEIKKVKFMCKEVVGENWYVNVGQDVMQDFGKDLYIKVVGDIFMIGVVIYQFKLEKDFNFKVGVDYGLDVIGKMVIKFGDVVNVKIDVDINFKVIGKIVSEVIGKVLLKFFVDVVMEGMNIKVKGQIEIVLEVSVGIKIVCGVFVIIFGLVGVIIDGLLVKVNCGGGGGLVGVVELVVDVVFVVFGDVQDQVDFKFDQVDNYDKFFVDLVVVGEGGGS